MKEKNESLIREMEYLYSALHSIMKISPFDAAYQIAETACNAYQSNRMREKHLDADKNLK